MSNMNVLSNIPASHADIIRTANWCCTKGEVFQCRFTWIIHDFLLNEPRMRPSKLQSSRFSARDDSCEWMLDLRIRKDCSNWLDITVSSNSDSSRQGTAGHATVSLIASSNKKSNTRRENFLDGGGWNGINFENFIGYNTLIAEKDQLLPNGELRIYCKLSYNRDVINVSNHSAAFVKSNPMPDFEKLLNDEETCDVIIDINGKKYPAHKTILAARSPVFKAMFKHNMTENQRNCVEIKDIDEKIFEEVLRYIYTGKVTKLQDMAFELMPVADKYILSELKDMCFNSMKALLSSKTAVKIFKYADSYNLRSLKRAAITYILANLQKVQKSDDWNEITSRPDLMLSILNHRG
ncbi:protein roadkill-like [Planococcus citri]|uniref:protein roadkill-like n=1 Tax=Planococcus citri TaxID=170843 RepID=UPI0031F91843